MEIVKRLEGSEPEEESFHFEEEYNEKTETNENNPKRPIFFPLLGVSAVIIVGYFGFKTFSSNKDTIDNSLKVTPMVENKAEGKELVVSQEELPKQEVKNNVQVHTIKEVFPSKEVVEPTKKVAVYTEELAQELTPKTTSPQEEIKNTNILPKTIQTTVPSKKIEEKEITPVIEKVVEAPKVEAPKVIETKTIEKKVIVKKAIPEKVVKEKVVEKKIVPKKIESTIVKRKPRIVTIKKGDTLNLIAQRYYGNSMDFKRIIRANKSLKSAKSSLRLGQKIIVPYLPKNKTRRFVTVKSGYSLAYISKKFYGTTGKVQKIVNANPDIKNKKSTLRIGQKVYVPR
ncbi:MAG: Unknown protein [uncultured Sulfurovum sp.]|uniref:LysM domain-containing protein n=1 Tax=uncultured Sulfurovum sp. TaxID=269237 RepID=A0A6S6TJK1_9BACT|nr:MAG: Unknown protein [uncultured Sulfurovum sp.]